jgi:hypothetical protein
MRSKIRILKKLKPQSIDMLVFKFDQEERMPDLPEVNGNKLLENENEFTIHEKEVLVHRSRVFYKSNLLSNFGFPEPLLTIGDCVTNDNYRGKGIYPHVIKYLGSRFSKGREVYVLVAPDNIASIRGIEKAGYTFVARLRAFRFLIFYFRKLSSPNKH